MKQILFKTWLDMDWRQTRQLGSSPSSLSCMKGKGLGILICYSRSITC